MPPIGELKAYPPQPAFGLLWQYRGEGCSDMMANMGGRRRAPEDVRGARSRRHAVGIEAAVGMYV